MKKIIYALLVVLILMTFLPVVEAKGKATIYIFSKEECPACKKADEYIEKLEEDESLSFEVVNIEVFDENGNIETKDGYDLMVSVLDHFDEDTEHLYTPTIVIGDYINVGFPTDPKDLDKAIKEVNDSDENVDIVKDLAKEKKIDLDYFRDLEKNQSVTDAIIIIGIFVFVVGVFSTLVIMGKK